MSEDGGGRGDGDGCERCGRGRGAGAGGGVGVDVGDGEDVSGAGRSAGLDGGKLVEDAARASAARAPSVASSGSRWPNAASAIPKRTTRWTSIGPPLAQVVDERAQLERTTQQPAASREAQQALAINTGGRRGERSGGRTSECLLQECVGASGGGQRSDRRGDRCARPTFRHGRSVLAFWLVPRITGCARSADRYRRQMVLSAGVDRMGDIAAPPRERSSWAGGSRRLTHTEAPIGRGCRARANVVWGGVLCGRHWQGPTPMSPASRMGPSRRMGLLGLPRNEEDV
jgi:hypothetical protein